MSSENEAERPDHGPAISLVIAAVFLALPLYVLTLLWWYGSDQEWRYRGSGRGSQGTGVGGPPIEIIRTSDGLEFGNAPTPTKARSKEEFVQHLVCFARIDGSYAPLSLYLRAKSFERFTANGVETKLRDETGGAPPEFGFPAEAGGGGGLSAPSGACRMTLTFLKNLEPVLPHAPLLTRLAGPQEFVACRDGAIRFPATIAAGDEYEMEFVPQRLFKAPMKIAEVPADSPYLQVDPLDSRKLHGIASEAIRAAVGTASGQRVLAIASHLEKTCVYSRQPSPVPPRTPLLEHFLTGNRNGHCQQISAAMVLLCRLNGIPARVAGGMVAGRDPASGLYQFSDASFHAWAEILTESGWAICEVSAARTQIDENAKPGGPLPNQDDLATAVEKAREANQRQGGGTLEETGELAMSEGERAGRARGGATRIADKKWPGRKTGAGSRKPEQLGTISGDKEKLRRAQEEEKKREAERKRRAQSSWWRMFSRVLMLLTLVFLVWKFNLLERFATAMIRGISRLWKFLFEKPARDDAAQRQQALQEASDLAERLQKADLPTLEGTDVVRLFNRFADVIGALFELSRPAAVETNALGVVSAGATSVFSWASRLESETVAEYFARIGEPLALDADRQGFLARTFAAALYGRKQIPPGEAQRFRDELRRLLQEARERLEQRGPQINRECPRSFDPRDDRP